MSLYKQLAFGGSPMDFSSLSGFGTLAAGNTQSMPTFGPVPAATPLTVASSPVAFNTDYSSLVGMGGTPQIGAPGGGGFFGGMSGLDKVQAGISGLATLGNLWGAFQAQKLAKKSFKLNKEMAQVNLGNQVKSYNTALADRARSRAVMEGQSDEQRDRYVRENSMTTKSGG